MKSSSPKVAWWLSGLLMSAVALIGCQTSDNAPWLPAPFSPPAPQAGPPPTADGVIAAGPDGESVPECAVRYEDALTGGRVFQMYCAACHNPRALGERPLASYENAANHMRVRANLTGEEYRKLMAFLRYWHDIPPQSPPVEPSPKRLIFSQPLSELRPEPAVSREELPAAPPMLGNER